MSKSEIANLQEILSSPTIRENKEIDQLQGKYLSTQKQSSSISLKNNQVRIYNPVEYLSWSFFAEIVNSLIFRKTNISYPLIRTLSEGKKC